ncbi:hypothetical protein LCGC14_3084990 [marine sediment metagenome]|uniref:Uncharacterized protein n=1 Tax=marine sediment metagenome TaxID=412755 RepID=A0A0F8YJU2_9ZZZZ
MIKEFKTITFEDVKDVEKGFILCHPDDVEYVTKIVKRWIASQLSAHYNKDVQLMIKEKKHVLILQGCSWLKNKIILITNKE